MTRDYNAEEYRKLFEQFKKLQELFDNQKKIIAALQERILELETGTKPN